MPLPDTFVTLAESGYQPAGSGHCKRCHARLEWFRTKKNRLMPFSLKMEVLSVDPPLALPSMTRYEPHFAVCPFAETFRRRH